MVQTSSMDIPEKEFLNLVRMQKLSTAVLYATFLGRLINAAQQDSGLKDALKSLEQIIHTGVALHKEEEDWAYANGLKIMVQRSSLFLDVSSRVFRVDIVWDDRDGSLAQVNHRLAHLVPYPARESRLLAPSGSREELRRRTALRSCRAGNSGRLPSYGDVWRRRILSYERPVREGWRWLDLPRAWRGLDQDSWWIL